MDIKIFQQKLSMEATSAYILIDSLRIEEARLGLALIQARWNSSEEELTLALGELLAHRVITLDPDSGEAEPVYRVCPAYLWGPAAPWPAPKGLPVFGDD